MITVRFPTGFSIQYNDACFVSRHSEYSDLCVKEGGRWIAQVPNSCVIEVVSPCRTYNPIAPDSDRVQASIELLAKDVRSLKRKLGK